MGSWLLGRRDDTRDALIEAALAELPRARAAWHRVLSAGISERPDGVVARWLPLVHQNIGRSLSDPRSIEILKQADREAWAHATGLLTSAAPVIRALREADIGAVLLKGAALAIVVYPHPGVRPFGDIDLLVRPTDFARAQSILTTLGWRNTAQRGGPADNATHAVTFSRGSTGTIDLHRYVMVDTGGPDVDQALWQRVEPAVAVGEAVSVLSPADHLVHTCVHGLRWSPVHAGTWIADAAWIVRRAGDRLDWSVLVDEAQRRRLSYQVAEALQLASRLARVPVPASALAALRARATFVERLECRANVRPRRGPTALLTFWLNWRRTSSDDRADGRGFLGYFAGKAGLHSASQLRGWTARYAKRQLRGWRRTRRPDGRSRGPTL